MNTVIIIPTHYSPQKINRHRTFGGLITEAQFGGAGCTLPYLISAEIFNARCKRTTEILGNTEILGTTETPEQTGGGLNTNV